MTSRRPVDANPAALAGFIKLLRAADSVAGRVHTALPEGLTVTQFAVLEALLHLGPLCHSELAAKVLKSTGNLTLVVKNLEKSGWVKRERQEDDNRFVKVALTPSGSRLIRDLFPKVAEAISREFSVLDATELETLSRLCKKLGVGRVPSALTAPLS